MELQAGRTRGGKKPLSHYDHGGDLRNAGKALMRCWGAVLFMWATFPNIGAAIKVMEAWGFVYKTAAFVWVKKYSKSGKSFVGMGAYTRANAEVCLLGVTPGIKAMDIVKNHGIRQIVEAPVERHSKKPDEVRRRIVALLGNAPRIELFARERADGWDAWGEEV